ncbi:MAG: hypothetical protein Q8R01_12540 [Ramlibacter sp.]|nr:hypothetical protein [Ramlibacter sp.]
MNSPADPVSGMARPPGGARELTIDVVELNPHAPRPFAFTEVALCLCDSLRAAGLQSNHRVNIANPQTVCIVLGAVPPFNAPLGQLDPRKTMVFNFEQLGSSSSIAGAEYLNWLRQWIVLDYHSRNVDFLRRVNGPAQSVLELPIVPGPSLAFRPDLPAEKSVDVLFFGSPNERRTALLHRLEEAGLRVEVVAGAYADELTPAIRRARLVLHVHYYETGLFPVARILQPVAAGVPVVCESSLFSAASDWSGSGILFAPYDRLVDACRQLLAAEDEQRRRAEKSRQFAARIDFAGPLDNVLRALLRRLETPAPGTAAPLPAQPAAVPRPIAPPQPIAPPRPATAREAPGPQDDLAAPLSTEQIEAILEREASELPPEANLGVPPLKLAERQPGQGRYGLWIVALLLIFSLYTIWQSMQR